MLFLWVHVLSKYVSLGDSHEPQSFILKVFLLISLILSEVFELTGGPLDHVRGKLDALWILEGLSWAFGAEIQ